MLERYTPIAVYCRLQFLLRSATLERHLAIGSVRNLISKNYTHIRLLNKRLTDRNLKKWNWVKSPWTAGAWWKRSLVLSHYRLSVCLSGRQTDRQTCCLYRHLSETIENRQLHGRLIRRCIWVPISVTVNGVERPWRINLPYTTFFWGSLWRSELRQTRTISYSAGLEVSDVQIVR